MLSIIKLRKLTIGCLDTEMYVLITFLGNKKGRRTAALVGCQLNASRHPGENQKSDRHSENRLMRDPSHVGSYQQMKLCWQ